MICFQRSSTRWSKGKAFCIIHFVMRFVLVSTVMRCVVFKGKINKKASKTDFMLQIFPIPFLTFPLESKSSHVTETEAWAWLRGGVIFKYALNQKQMLPVIMYSFAIHFLWQRKVKLMPVFSVGSVLYICFQSAIHHGACCFWVLVAQSCLTLCNPMDCSPPGSSVHGIFQARILEWVGIPFSRGSSRSRDWTQFSCTAGRFFTDWATRKVHIICNMSFSFQTEICEGRNCV